MSQGPVKVILSLIVLLVTHRHVSIEVTVEVAHSLLHQEIVQADVAPVVVVPSSEGDGLEYEDVL